MKFTNNDILTTNITHWNGHLGHTIADFGLADILSDDQLTEIKNKWYHWNLLSFTCNIKLVSARNWYRVTTSGGSLANIYWNEAHDPRMMSEMYIGFFRYSGQQQAVLAIDADAATENQNKLMETGCYQRLIPMGKGATFTWFNSNAYKGVYVDIGNPTVGTTLATAFLGGMPTTNEPHGFDWLLLNRDRYQTLGGTEQFSARVQIATYATIAVRNRKPVDK